MYTMTPGADRGFVKLFVVATIAVIVLAVAAYAIATVLGQKLDPVVREVATEAVKTILSRGHTFDAVPSGIQPHSCSVMDVDLLGRFAVVDFSIEGLPDTGLFVYMEATRGIGPINLSFKQADYNVQRIQLLGGGYNIELLEYEVIATPSEEASESKRLPVE